MSLVTEEDQQKIRERQDVPAEDRWNVEALYPSWKEWEEDIARWGREKETIHWPEIAAFESSFCDNCAPLFDLLFDIDRALSKLYTYSHLRHDEEMSEDRAKSAHARAIALLHAFKQETAWIEPAILALPKENLKKLLVAPELALYHVHLEKIIRAKPHTLAKEQEELLALSGQALETAHKAFGMLNNADMKFPSVLDAQSSPRELTHGTYSLFLQGGDRVLRKNAFQALHNTFSNYENTFCELLQGQVQNHLFHAKARRFPSCLEAALFPHQIDKRVYTTLIDTVRTHLPSAHRYMTVRKKMAGLEELHLYDLHMPLIADVQMRMSYAQACEHIIESVAVLGSEYQNELRQGLINDRWVDRYENRKKRSGAYSSGCYDSFPYILMNYQGTYRDVMTLTHEAGHSMHSQLSKRKQPYLYSQYPIFVAEVASTFHEELLFSHFMKHLQDPATRAFLINQKIDDLRTTLLRQTMFAEFELKLHEWAEKGEPFTPARLKDAYRKLNTEYFGPDVVIDPEIDIEWARIPHFYYNFYVYQYATGISAALALADQVSQEGSAAVTRYLAFLSGGCYQYPLDLLRIAGVDMTQAGPVEAAMRRFDELVEEIAKLAAD